MKVHVVVQSSVLGTVAVLAVYDDRRAALEAANAGTMRRVITLPVRRKR